MSGLPQLQAAVTIQLRRRHVVGDTEFGLGIRQVDKAKCPYARQDRFSLLQNSLGQFPQYAIDLLLLFVGGLFKLIAGLDEFIGLDEKRGATA